MHSMIWQSRSIRYVTCQPNMQITLLLHIKIKKLFRCSMLFMIMLMELNSSLEVVSCKPLNETKENAIPLFYSYNIIFAHIIMYTKTQPHTIKNILERIKKKIVISNRHQTMIANKYGKMVGWWWRDKRFRLQ